VLVAREMGWTIDYTLDISITQYNQVKKAIIYYYNEQKKASEQGAKPSTRPLTLR
jgi:TnpA family transposase